MIAELLNIERKAENFLCAQKAFSPTEIAMGSRAGSIDINGVNGVIMFY